MKYFLDSRGTDYKSAPADIKMKEEFGLSESEMIQ